MPKQKPPIAKSDEAALFADPQALIEQSRKQAALSFNTVTTSLYWNVGKRINESILKNQRAEYGKEIVKNMSKKLTLKYGRGWGEKHLRHCLRFAETFDFEIVSALRRQLGWTQLKTLKAPHFLNLDSQP